MRVNCFKNILLCSTFTAAFWFSSQAHANPEGGQVVGGNATIESAAGRVDVRQRTDRAVIDWRSFDIESGEQTNFIQPSQNAIALNRIKNGNPSRINGNLTASGNIILVNPNGVFFGKNSKVDVNGLIATTADTGNDRFMAGESVFDKTGNPEATVANEGQITAKEAGLVGLVAPNVENSGVINARLGKVALASGDGFAVDMSGHGLYSLKVSDKVKNQLVSNTGKIDAAGGEIQITAAAGAEIVNSLINVEGELKAPSISNHNGSITISGEGSNAVSGNVREGKGQKKGQSSVVIKNADVGASGGKIKALADKVTILGTTILDASGENGGGEILVGGQYQGKGETPTASSLWVDKGVTANVSAKENGNAGTAIFWADNSTRFFGSVLATGGRLGGDGGMVEVSGRDYLTFKGYVDTTAANGLTGTLLLDPADIIIANGSGDSAADGTATYAGSPSGATGTVQSADTGPTAIYESELQGLSATTNISLTASNGITINNLSDNTLALAQNAGRSVTFSAGNGGIAMLDTADTISLNGGALNFTTTGTGGVTLGNISTTSGLTTFNVAGTSSVAGVISGTGGVTKTGTGTLTLSGNNTYSGTTTLTAGTIAVGSNTALGTGTFSMNGGTLSGDGTARTLTNNVTLAANSIIGGSSDITFNGSFTNSGGNRTLTNNSTGATTLAGTVNLSNNATNRTLTVAGTGNTTISGTIQNGSTSTASALTKSGTGTLTITGNNTYAGTTTISAGTIAAGSNTALGTGTLSLSAGTLTASGAARTLANNVTLAANSTIGGSNELTINGSFTNSAGNRTLTNNNTGATTLAGTVNLSNDATNRTMTVAGTGNLSVTGVIQNGGTSTASAITKSSTGILTLTGNNTYAGATTLSAGTTAIGSNTAFGTGTVSLGGSAINASGEARTLANNVNHTVATTISGSNGLTFNGTFTNTNNLTLTNNNTGGTTLAGTVNLSNSATNRTLTVTGTGNTTISGTIQNGSTSTASALTKSGTGTLTITGNNTYAGTTTLSAGTLAAGSNTALGTGTISLSGGTLTASGAARTLANNVTLAANSTIGGSNGLTFNGNFTSGAYTLTNNNTAMNTFAGNTTLTGNTTHAGSGSTTFSGAFTNSAGNRTLTNNGTGLITLAGTVNLSESATNRTLTVAGTGSTTISGTIQNGSTSTASALTKSGTGTLTITGNNTYAGTTTISAGTLAAGSNTALGTGTLSLSAGTLTASGSARTFANNVTLAANSTLAGSLDMTFNGSLTNSAGNRTLTNNNTGSTTFAGTVNLSESATNRTMTVAGTGNTTISGTIQNGSTSTASALTKTGNGILTLSGNNTYAGATTVNAGTLRLGAANRISNLSAVTVGASGTFDLAGYADTVKSITNSGAVTLGTGGALTTTTTQTHTGTVTGNNASLGGTTITANNAANDFTGTLGITASGAVSVVDANDLTLGNASASTLTANAPNGDLTLQGAVIASTATGTSITLRAGDQFINNAGASALTTSGTARFLVFSANSQNDTRGGLTGFNRYGCTYNAGAPNCAAGTSKPSSGNGFYMVAAPTITATPSAVAALTYGDAAPSLTGYAYTLSGYLGSDSSSDTITGSLNGTTNYTQGSNAGSYYINRSTGTLSSAMGYTLAYANNASAITVNPRAITLTASDQSRNYGFGGNSAALGTSGYTISSGSLYGTDAISGVTLSTDATTSGSGNYIYSASPWSITPSAAAFSSGSGSNYNITYANAASGLAISRLALTVNSITPADKVYDGTTAATITGYTFDNAVAGDDVSVGGIGGVFDTAAVGTNKTVTLSAGTISGIDSGNYNFTLGSVTGTANITSSGSGGGGGGGGGSSGGSTGGNTGTGSGGNTGSNTGPGGSTANDGGSSVGSGGDSSSSNGGTTSGGSTGGGSTGAEPSRQPEVEEVIASIPESVYQSFLLPASSASAGGGFFSRQLGGGGGSGGGAGQGFSWNSSKASSGAPVHNSGISNLFSSGFPGLSSLVMSGQLSISPTLASTFEQED